MRFHGIAQRFTYRLAQLYTALLKPALGHCGRKALIYFPVRLDGPSGISLGAGTILYSRVWMTAVEMWAGKEYQGRIELGDGTVIGHGVQISAAKEIVIGKCVGIGSGAVIVDHNHDYAYPELPIIYSPLSEPEPIRIGDNAFIGVHALIAPGITIGEHAFIGANAVVLRDVPAYSVVAGNPARVVRTGKSELRQKSGSELERATSAR